MFCEHARSDLCVYNTHTLEMVKYSLREGERGGVAGSHTVEV